MTGEKILVVSDTHGNIPALEAVLKWAAADKTINTAFFLGDGLQDLNRVPATGFSPEWVQVKGNNDYAPSVPEVAVFELNGHRFFLCHGHRFRLNNNYDTLFAAARNTESEAVFFGHLHIPVFEKADGLLLVNPGSVGWPRNNTGASFAVINCKPQELLNVEFWSIDDHGKIFEFFPLSSLSKNMNHR